MTKLKTVSIKGKPYVTVNERIKYFREHYPEYGLETEIIEVNEETALMKAIIKDQEGRIIATGVAHEIASDGYINKTSHIENCETSAWGRALGNLGIGINESVASAEEVVGAISRPEKKKPTKTQVMEKITEAKDIGEAEKILSAAIKYDWSDEEKKDIKDCYNNVISNFVSQPK